MKDLKKILISLVVCQAAGVIGALFTMPAIGGWYAFLNRPSFAPPNWVFAPAWTALFFLMGISLYLIWKRGLKENRDAILTFILQLVLNTWWSVIFFGLGYIGIAFIEIIALWLAIFLTILKFAKVSKVASFLLLPYILWVSFAGVLNFFFWKLN